jgi:PKD repeat protein
MKKRFTVLVLLCLSMIQKTQAECVLVPLPLKDRVSASTLIVEAMVGEKTSFWDDGQRMIYTSSELHISRIYKGSELLNSSSVHIITLGGKVGMQAIKVEPELELETGEIGIFMLVHKDGQWVAESGPQGFIRIDKHTGAAHDVFYSYEAFSISNTIISLTNMAVTPVNEHLTKVRINNKRATPSISSISPKSMSAGTSTILTIKGMDFKSVRDTSSVQFRNADDGGGSFVKALKRDYISWSDTMIRLIVRTSAGTGKIRVNIGGNGIVTSSDTLKITYAHLNVVSADTMGYETQEIGMNSSSGITWKLNKSFYDSAGARSAFARSLERWRCGTYINWDTLGTVKYSDIRSDGVNMCAWDTSGAMPNGVLAQCFSFWSGCFTPGLKWYVNELDIRFRVKPTNTTNWNYTSGNTTSSQFHFESVATHELGHGHQMGHVINSLAVMHFAIANGQTKPSLSTDDISAGNYVIGKSGTSVCGKTTHKKLNSGNCAMVAPSAGFTFDTAFICKNESIKFQDSSIGNISLYSWDFGAGATPATAATLGPHTVKYTSGGIKTISLTVTTLQGTFSKTKTIQVAQDSRMISKFTYTAAEKGKVTFTNTSNNPLSSQWDFGDTDTSSMRNPMHQYTSGGSFPVTLTAANTCDTRDTSINVKFAWLNFYSNTNTVCLNEPVIYTDSSDNLVSTWQWSFPGGTPSAATGKGPHAITYSSAGNKTAGLNITVAGAPGQTYTRTNIVSAGSDTFATAAFTYGYYGQNKVGFINQSKGSISDYTWYFGDGDSSTLKDPVHQYTSANNMQVTLKVKGACNNPDTLITLRNFTSVQTPAGSSFFEVWPNPSSKFVEIRSSSQELIDVDMMDATGKVIFRKTVSGGDQIMTNMLPEGLYFLKIQSGAIMQSTRLVICR